MICAEKEPRGKEVAVPLAGRSAASQTREEVGGTAVLGAPHLFRVVLRGQRKQNDTCSERANGIIAGHRRQPWTHT